MSKTIVSTPNAPGAIGPYSQAVIAGGFLFASGQIPLDPTTGEMVQGDIEQQTERVMLNLQGVLNAAGLSFSNVVRCTIFLTNLGDFARVNAVYGKYFPSAPPSRATVQVSALPKGAQVEIDLVAHVG